MMFAISENGEIYHGSYETIEAAIDEAVNGHAYDSFYAGECQPPIQPELCFDAGDWIERVSVHDDYCNECAEGWCNATKIEMDEIEQQVRKVMAEWIDRHKLRPTFFCIPYAIKFIVINGKAIKGGK